MTNIQGFGNGYVGSTAAEKTATTAAAQPRAAESAKPQAAPTQDAASLSGAGSLLATASDHADQARAQKVEQARAALANGTYNVSAADVADKLVKNMLG